MKCEVCNAERSLAEPKGICINCENIKSDMKEEKEMRSYYNIRYQGYCDWCGAKDPDVQPTTEDEGICDRCLIEHG